jgi:hypothetical protein
MNQTMNDIVNNLKPIPIFNDNTDILSQNLIIQNTVLKPENIIIEMENETIHYQYSENELVDKSYETEENVETEKQNNTINPKNEKNKGSKRVINKMKRRLYRLFKTTRPKKYFSQCAEGRTQNGRQM